MNTRQATEFTYRKTATKCPSCGETLLKRGRYLFCEREFGTRTPPLAAGELPVATRTARTGRLIIDGEEGFWRVPSHAHRGLRHAGPPVGAIIALLTRYNSKIPTAVALIRAKSPHA